MKVSELLWKGPIKKSLMSKVSERIAIAPMVDVSDTYFRHFIRSLSKNVVLYTEMLNEHAILYGKDKLLDMTDCQHPVVCQIGGNDP